MHATIGHVESAEREEILRRRILANGEETSVMRRISMRQNLEVISKKYNTPIKKSGFSEKPLGRVVLETIQKNLSFAHEGVVYEEKR